MLPDLDVIGFFFGVRYDDMLGHRGITHSLAFAMAEGGIVPQVVCTATVETVGPTGVEMEALTAVQVALLTIYDMCKAVDRGMRITDVHVLEKHGGKSGSWVAD